MEIIIIPAGKALSSRVVFDGQ